ncbi:MAG: sugar kinase [Candidatus Lokiarchaeota archaeon]|nr:sugar kinase [Candidatus Lokiarchaeota archaeon]MBD3337661.1 sugar kinase [Candidatus Lokiarchaeota archaeon]
MDKNILTFGEIMLRLAPPSNKRFTQARSFDVVYGGGEANVAVSLANFGFSVDFVTRLPKNALGDACIQYLQQFGVNTSKIVRGGDRIGIYFLEIGASARPSKVIYDRGRSGIATAEPGVFNWDKLFKDVGWFHITGITPAISQNLADICLEAVSIAKKKDITVSCDLNYRSKLWKYGKEPFEVMPKLVKYCDVVIGNEEDAEKVLRISAPNTDVTSGELKAENYRYVVTEMKKQFKNLQKIAITLRGSISASYNTWSAVLYDGNQMYKGPQYDITPIVDRVGGGDSFMGGLIYGLLNFKDSPQKALDFAVAASCLKHTIYGDFNLVSIEEVLNVMKGDTSGRVSR